MAKIIDIEKYLNFIGTYLINSGIPLNVVNYQDHINEIREYIDNRGAREPEVFQNMFNCNLKSYVQCIEKKNYKDILK